MAISLAITAVALGIGVDLLRLIRPQETDQASADWRTYTDRQDGFSFRYPPDLRPMTDVPDLFSYYTDRTNRVYFEFPISDTLASTTGIESAFSFGVSSSTASCSAFGGSKPIEDNITAPVTMPIVSTTFEVVHLDGCAPSGCLDIYQYSTTKSGLCYRADWAIYEGLPLDETVPQTISGDESARIQSQLKAIFQGVLESLTLFP